MLERQKICLYANQKLRHYSPPPYDLDKVIMVPLPNVSPVKNIHYFRVPKVQNFPDSKLLLTKIIRMKPEVLLNHFRPKHQTIRTPLYDLGLLSNFPQSYQTNYHLPSRKLVLSYPFCLTLTKFSRLEKLSWQQCYRATRVFGTLQTLNRLNQLFCP